MAEVLGAEKNDPNNRAYAVKQLEILRWVSGLFVAIVFVLHAAGGWVLPFLVHAENFVYDFKQCTARSPVVDRHIVIVTVNKIFEEQAETLAHLVDGLFDGYGIRLLGLAGVMVSTDSQIGMHLLEQLAQGPLSHDQEFLSVLAKLRQQEPADGVLAGSLANRPVVLGYRTGNVAPPKEAGPRPPPLAPAGVWSFSTFLPVAQPVTTHLAVLQRAAQAAGFINDPIIYAHGLSRKFPLLAHHQGYIYEAFALAVFGAVQDMSAVEFITADPNGGLSGIRLRNVKGDSITVPVDGSGAVSVPFCGEQNRFDVVVAADVLEGYIAPGRLRGKIVIVTAAHPASLQAGVIQARIVSALLAQNFKSRPGYLSVMEALFLAGASLLIIGLGRTVSVKKAGAACVLALAALAAVHAYCWYGLAIDTALVTPAVLICLLFSLQPCFGFFQERYRKKQLTAVFGPCVPPQTLVAMGQSGKSYAVSAESREMTVFFADIRGFTSIAERMEPKVLSELSNAIFTLVTQAIHETGGSLDKYMGDAVMAFWGAPLDNPNHAGDAVRSALKIVRALEKLKWFFIAQGWPAIDMGIGINTGLMRVGSMGSQFRTAYTVMGDAVNLGSRLESLTKYYGVKIVVSEVTCKAAPEFVYRELDTVRVQGRQDPVIIYEPVAEKTAVSAEKIGELYLLRHGLAHYRQQHWQPAQEIFLQLAGDHPDDKLYPCYLERIRHYLRCPPGNAWDGVFTHA